MQPIHLKRDHRHPLVDQIVEGVRRQIDDRGLRPGARLPSIRAFADSHGVSRHTVVEAYDRLVAQGYLFSRRGAGFFTTSPHRDPHRPGGECAERRDEELVWLIRRLLEAPDGTLLAGGPWLPESWLDDPGIRRALRALAGRPGGHTIHYGDPLGYGPLREQIAGVLLPDIGVSVRPSRIMLTHGASQALDLIIRRLLDPGDTVLVDDPGYYNLFGNLKLNGIRLVGVPRRRDGPDPAALESLAAEHRPKLYFTQSVLQNPTGTNIAPHVAYRILQTAGRHDFRIVEDDIFSDLESENVARLATLDQLERVIYVGSFSKTLSGSLRVGFIACSAGLVHDLLDAKLVTSIASSPFSEKLVHYLLADGHYRKFTARIRERLGAARCRLGTVFEGAGIETFCQRESGLFVWGRFQGEADSLPLAEAALKQGMLLAPGRVFRPGLKPSPWMRFNVAVCDEAAAQQQLEALLGRMAA